MPVDLEGRPRDEPALRVLVTGSTGLIGSALTTRLEQGGHSVVRLVRSRDTNGGDAFFWDPPRGELDEAALAGVDAVVHLAGETIAGRWTDDKKRRIRESRIASTRLLSEAIACGDQKPAVFVCASAVGIYGDRGDAELTEESPPGGGFLAGVVIEWEAATEPAARAGVRVVNVRSGEVLSHEGGPLAALLTPFRLGLGGPLGGGHQYTSWISIDDEVAAIEHALTSDGLEGPVNLVAPNPVTNREFAKTLGRVLRRPAVLPTPLAPLKLVYGSEFVREVLLFSTRAFPAKLDASGYRFEHTDIERAFIALLRG
jgi:uncharacterized protein (TIGR01777 family)